MNSPAKELLNDLINERDRAFDERLVTGTLNAVRRQRTRRRAGNGVLALTALFVLAVCWMKIPSTPAPVIASHPAPHVSEFLVQTRALSGQELVLTTAGAFSTVTSASDSALVVNTVPSPDLYQLISDVELRMLLAEHNPVLLRQPNRRPQLLLDGKLFDGRLNVN
jgi:hypothetical protein